MHDEGYNIVVSKAANNSYPQPRFDPRLVAWTAAGLVIAALSPLLRNLGYGFKWQEGVLAWLLTKPPLNGSGYPAYPPKLTAVLNSQPCRSPPAIAMRLSFFLCGPHPGDHHVGRLAWRPRMQIGRTRV